MSQARDLFLVGERLDARQLLPFQKLQRCSAPGGDVGDAVRNACIVYGGNGVATADDRSSARIIDNRMGGLLRAARKWVFFEYAHGTVPDDRFSPFDLLRKKLDRLRPDVQGHHLRRDE